MTNAQVNDTFRALQAAICRWETGENEETRQGLHAAIAHARAVVPREHATAPWTPPAVRQLNDQITYAETRLTMAAQQRARTAVR